MKRLILAALLVSALWADAAFAAGTCAIQQITATTADPNLTPRLSSDGTRIAFQSRNDLTGGNPAHGSQVFLYDTTTGRITQLTHALGGFVTDRLALDDDGTRIVFRSDRNLVGGNGDGNFELFLYDTTAATLTQITNTTGGGGIANRSPAMNGDGTRIAFASNRDLTGGNPDLSSEVFVFDLTTASFEQITGTGPSDSGAPALSADGSRIAFVSNGNFTGGNADGSMEAFLYDATAGAFTQITNAVAPGFLVAFEPAISTDGGHVAFTSTSDLVSGNADGNAEIFHYDVAAGSLSQVTDTLGATFAANGSASLSGDGSRIAFVSTRDLTGSNPDLSREVFVFDPATGAFAQVTDTAGERLQPAPVISADGSKIVFLSDRDQTGGNGDLNGEIFLATCGASTPPSTGLPAPGGRAEALAGTDDPAEVDTDGAPGTAEAVDDDAIGLDSHARARAEISCNPVNMRVRGSSAAAPTLRTSSGPFIPGTAASEARVLCQFTSDLTQGAPVPGGVEIDVGVVLDGTLDTFVFGPSFTCSGECPPDRPIFPNDAAARVELEVIGHRAGLPQAIVFREAATLDLAHAAAGSFFPSPGWVGAWTFPADPPRGTSALTTIRAQLDFFDIVSGRLVVPVGDVFAIELVLRTSANSTWIGRHGSIAYAAADFFNTGSVTVSTATPGVVLSAVDELGRPVPAPGPADIDGDGVEDGVDNCRETPNRDQADDDADGAGNVCDPPVAEIAIDVKPGSDENPVNPNAGGVIPVAILTSAGLNPALIDAASVRFGPGGAAEAHGRAHLEDVDGDGDTDLVFHFDTRESGIRPGDTTVSLAAETLYGLALLGTDSIRTP